MQEPSASTLEPISLPEASPRGKWVRDYSSGNLRDIAGRLETVEELTQFRNEIVEAYEAGVLKLSTRARKKLELMMNTRYKELKTRLVVAPPRGKLWVPKDNRVKAGGGLIIKPGE